MEQHNENIIDIDTDELLYVVNNVNECNINLYRKIYSIGVSMGDGFLNSRIVALMSVSDRYEASFIALHINTIFLEFIRNKLSDKGIDINADCNLVEAVNVYDVVEEIIINDDVVSCLQEVSMDNMDVFTISNMLGIDINDIIANIASYEDFIKYLYDNNRDAIYRDYSEPVTIPTVL